MENRKRLPYIWFGPIITMVIMLVLYAIGGIYPFGTATTAFSDGLAQYIPFLVEMGDKIKNGGSLFFSWHAGNGINFWANIAYYLASPLNLLALLFPPERMDDAFSFITLIKPALMALTFGIYLKYSYKKNDWSIAIFSVLWALSGFMISGMYITSWYDAIIYFPLVILGINCLMEGKSAIYYSLFLGLTIATNFYIGWIVCIFCVIYFIYRFIADDDVTYEGVSAGADEEQSSDDSSVNIFAVFKNSYLLGSFFRFVFSSLLAGGISAIMTLPTFLALQKTGKGAILPDTFNFGIHGITGLLASHIFPFKNNYSTLIAKDCIFAFVGIASIILCVSYFFIKGISLRKKIGNFFLLAVFWISVIFHGLSFAWHGFGEPAGILYRFAFIYSFVLLKIAFEAFTNIKNIPIWGLLSGTAFSAVCIACIYFSELFRTLYFSVELIVLLAVFTVVFTILLVLMTKKGNLQNVLSVVLLVSVVVEAVVLNYNNINIFEFSNNLEEHKYVDKAAEYLDESERLSFASGRQTFNNMIMYGQIFGYNSLEYYSSIADENFSTTINSLGSYGNRLNYQDGAQEQTPVFNLLYPTAYYLDGTGRLEENSFRTKIYEENGYTLFANNYTMPFMFTVDYNVENWDPFTYVVSVDNQNEAVKAITGTDEDVLYYNVPTNFVYENCEHISVVERMKDVYAEDGREFPEDARKYYEYLESKMADFSYKILDLGKPASIKFDSVAAADGIMYIYIDTKEFTDVSVSLNGKSTDYYSYGVHTGRMYEIGEVKAGDVATLCFKGNNTDDSVNEQVYFMEQSSLSAVCCTVDMAKFKKAYEKLESMSDTEIVEFSDTYVKAKITSNTDGGLYISTPYDEGWTITIDGEEVPLYEHESHILMTEISKGEHIVEMKYVPQGFILGAVITGVSVLILIAWAVISTKRFKKEQENDIIVSNDVNEE